MSGQRVLRVTMTPFSTEKESAGKPAMLQSLTSLGSARKEAKSNSSEAGRLSAFTYAASESLFTIVSPMSWFSTSVPGSDGIGCQPMLHLE